VILLDPRRATRYYPEHSWSTRWVVWNESEAVVLERLSGLGRAGQVVKGGAGAVFAAWCQLEPRLERQDFAGILDRKLALLEMLRELAALLHAGAAGQDSRFLEPALRALARDTGTPEPVATVARRLHLSPAHFRRRFKAQTGTSPKAYQVAQRITRAKQLLAAGRSIKVTADTLGFADVFHFMRRFRQVTGQTAGQFTVVFGRQHR